MPQEPYWEVMAYTQAKAQSVAVSSALVTNIGAAASGIVTNLLTAFAGASLDTLKPELFSYFGRMANLASLFKSAPLENIDILIENELNFDYLFIIEAMKAGIGQGVGGVHASLYETTTGTNALLQSYNGLITRIGCDPIISRWANNRFTPNIIDADGAWFLRKLNALSPADYTSFMAQNGWGIKWLGQIDLLNTRVPPIEAILDMRRRGTISDDDLTFMLKYYRFSDLTINGVKNLTIQYPEPYRLAEMFSKARIDSSKYIHGMSTYGIDTTWADAWAGVATTMPVYEQLIALWRRGIIGEADYKAYMIWNGYNATIAEQLAPLKDVIPPIQDLIRFAVREAYGEHDPEKQYPAMVEIAGKMGLTSQAAEWYWYSHWERIPVNLMYQNYYRGYWDKTKLERMLKIVDVHPDDRADIIGVAYQPPSIREQGYGYDVQAYTLDDIKRYRRWGGLSPEDADKAALAMVAYRTEAERNSVRTEYVYAYGRGALTSEELLTKLKDIKTPEEALPLWMERADYYKERIQKPQMDIEGKLVSSAEALAAFKLGLRSEEWTRAALKELEWIDERIGVAIEKANFEIIEKQAKEETTKYRTLTLAQLRQFYLVKLLSKEDMTTEIIIMGYSPNDADLLTEIYTRPDVTAVKPKVFTAAVAANLYALSMYDEDDLYQSFLDLEWDESQAALLTIYTLISQEYPLLRTQYSKGAISGEQMVLELVKLEMPEFNARELVKKTYRELQVDRVSHEKDLTKAEIIKGVKNAVLTPSQGAELLQGIGYDSDEAYYILAINKVLEMGDPQGYWEMRKVTELSKKARGEKGIDIPEELILLEVQQRKLRQKLEEVKKRPENEQEIANVTIQLGTIEQQMKQTIIAKNLK
jgi:hypothetical protein